MWLDNIVPKEISLCLLSCIKNKTRFRATPLRLGREIVLRQPLQQLYRVCPIFVFFFFLILLKKENKKTASARWVCTALSYKALTLWRGFNVVKPQGLSEEEKIKYSTNEALTEFLRDESFIRNKIFFSLRRRLKENRNENQRTNIYCMYIFKRSHSHQSRAIALRDKKREK